MITVDVIRLRNGTSRLVVKGNTYPIRKQIGGVPGLRWEGRLRAWAGPATPSLAAGIASVTPDACATEAIRWSDEAKVLCRCSTIERDNLESVRKFQDLDLPDRWSEAGERPRWQHQRAAFQAFNGATRGLLYEGMGTGKSFTALDLASAANPARVLIAAPKAAILGVWPGEISKHGWQCRVAAVVSERADVDPDWTVPVEILNGTTQKKAEKLRAWLEHSTEVPSVVLINYESAWRKGLAELLLSTPWDVGVLDECLPAGELINTPSGLRSIEALRPGDSVYGYEDGVVVVTKVIDIMTRETGEVWTVAGRRMTPNHPVWTDRGYLPLHSVREFDTLTAMEVRRDKKAVPVLQQVVCSGKVRCSSERDRQVQSEDVLLEELLGESERSDESATSLSGLRVLRHGVSASEDLVDYPVLRKVLLSEMASSPAGASSGSDSLLDPREEGGEPGKDVEADEGSRVHQSTQRLRQQRSESVSRRVRAGDQGEGVRRSGGERVVESERRERDRADGPAAEPVGGAGPRVEDGARCRSAGGQQIAPPLQGGHSEPGTQDCDRGGRAVAPDAGENRSRQEARCEVPSSRVDGSPIQERSYLIQPVYNIETGTGNYFVNGLLVHNCQKIKGPGGKQSRFFARLAGRVPRRFGLSGTPCPHSPLDAYGVFRFLDAGIFGENYTAFRSRFAILGGFEGRQVIGYQNEEEFNRRFYSITFRADTEDVLDLPEKHHVERVFDMPPAAVKVYRELAEEYVTLLSDPAVTVTAQNALSKVAKLQQIACGFVKDDDGEWQQIHTAREAALVEALEEIDPHEPVVIFCRFILDYEAVHRAAKSTGRKSFELTGRKDQLREWKKDTGGSVLVASGQSAAEAVDLTRACYCGFYSHGTSLGQFDQACARVHRPGQARRVTYFHLVARKTVDRKLIAAHRSKREILDMVLADPRWLI